MWLVEIILFLLLVGCCILFEDLQKRICNAISYIKILIVQKKIDENEAEQLLKILRWQGK